MLEKTLGSFDYEISDLDANHHANTNQGQLCSMEFWDLCLGFQYYKMEIMQLPFVIQ